MELEKVRRATSAGYRLAERPRPSRTLHSASVQKPHRTRSNEPDVHPPDKLDPVKQDQAWRDYVQTEAKGVREWEKNWSFLKNYDQMGRLKPERPLPDHVSLFSDRVPNTASHALGSRLATPLGRELVKMDRLLLWAGSSCHHHHHHHHKAKQDPEMLPS